MLLSTTAIPGAFLVDLRPHADPRGFFARVFCCREWADAGLVTAFAQINTSYSCAKGTLRGLHYQIPPRAETKVVRCINGAIWDVLLDLRPVSPTFGQYFGVELSAQNRRMVYCPKGVAHGFITLTEGAEVIYLVDEFYSPECERGIRWNDPRFSIEWPITPTVVSDKDRGHADFHGRETSG
jgi:dTDP-4-dehydrorhamnose 3,5-epimerase